MDITTEVKKLGRPPSTKQPQNSYCEICQQDFSTAKSLKLHKMTNKHKNKENPKSTFCETCEKDYVTVQKLKMHMMTNKHILLVQQKSVGDNDDSDSKSIEKNLSEDHPDLEEDLLENPDSKSNLKNYYPEDPPLIEQIFVQDPNSKLTEDPNPQQQSNKLQIEEIFLEEEPNSQPISPENSFENSQLVVKDEDLENPENLFENSQLFENKDYPEDQENEILEDDDQFTNMEKSFEDYIHEKEKKLEDHPEFQNNLKEGDFNSEKLQKSNYLDPESIAGSQNPPKRKHALSKKQKTGKVHCEICVIDISNQMTYEKHIKTNRHILKAQGKLLAKQIKEGNKEGNECFICRKSFVDNQGLQKHTASVHEGKKDYRCHLCQKYFTTSTGNN